MACMEHICVECDTAIFNNYGGPSNCPKCGSRMAHFFDEPQEPPERDEPDRECDEDEQDED